MTANAFIDSLESMSKQQLMLMLARRQQEETQSIAIVGIGCRLPGGVDDPAGFWELVRNGRVVSVGGRSGCRERWNLDAPDIAPIAHLLEMGAYLDHVDRFDAAYFGIAADEACQIDPQQRLFLEVAAAALADANLPRSVLRGRKVAVLVALGPPEYQLGAVRNGVRIDRVSPHLATGSIVSSAGGRLALWLQSQGLAMTVDTACSSGLVAVHLAMGALRRRECDVAIVGASSLILSPLPTAAVAKAGLLSPTGRSRPFAANADGYVRAEGCGVVVLRRHRDAADDGQPVYAVIRGSHVHQWGERAGLTFPSASSQRAVIRQALEQAEIDPHDVAYLEAHANGAKLGGVIEAESSAQAYDRAGADAPPLYIGSCKANFGYLETAAGIVGLIKAALAVSAGEIPPQPHMDEPEPAIPWGRLSLRFTSSAIPWTTSGRRMAGVSGFGITGVNAHVLLGRAGGQSAVEEGPAAARPAMLVVSGHHRDAVHATAGRLHDFLLLRPALSHLSVCRTLSQGRDREAFAFEAVVRDRAELLARLAAWADPCSTADVAPPSPATVGDERPSPAFCRLPAPALIRTRHWIEECRYV